MVQHSASLSVGQLVCVTQYYPPVNDAPQIGPALAVGHLVLTSDQIRGVGKGKAVNIVHTWKDHLWEMGEKGDPPAPRVIEPDQQTNSEVGDEGLPTGDPDASAGTKSGSPGEDPPQPQDESPATPPKGGTRALSQQGTLFNSFQLSGCQFLTGKV